MRYEFRATLGAPVETEEAFVTRCRDWMASRLAERQDAWHCWVFDTANGIAGQLWLQLLEKMPNPSLELELHGYITNVYVRPEVRGAGVGGRLVETALTFCRERGVDSVLLWPTARSRALYARYGFAVQDDVMELRLDAGRTL